MKSSLVLRTGRRDGDFMRRAVRGDGTQGAARGQMVDGRMWGRGFEI